MTVGYETAVLIISLALFGIYCLIEELWHYKKRTNTPPVAVLFIVQNAEHEIEHLIRSAMRIIDHHAESEIIVVDIASNDMTRAILARLAEQDERIRILHRAVEHHAVTDGIALASGHIIHLCDLVHRTDTDNTLAYLERLARIP